MNQFKSGLQALKNRETAKAIWLLKQASLIKPSKQIQDTILTAEAIENGSLEWYYVEDCIEILIADNYYHMLKVSKQASIDEINKAYSELKTEVDPENNKSPFASETFKQLSKAHSYLTDVESRAKYDQFLENSKKSKIWKYLTCSNLLHWTPVLALLCITVFLWSKEKKIYSLVPNQEFSVQEFTQKLEVEYWLQPKYSRSLTLLDKKKLDQEVEEHYIQDVKNKCLAVHNAKNILDKAGDYYSDLKDKSKGVDVRWCEKYEALKNKVSKT